MPFTRQQIRNIPVFGYLFSIAFSVAKLPAMWADLHRDAAVFHQQVINLNRNVAQVSEAQNHLRQGLTNAQNDFHANVVRKLDFTNAAAAEHCARLIDHAGQLSEHLHELGALQESIKLVESAVSALQESIKVVESAVTEQQVQLANQQEQITEVQNRAQSQAAALGAFVDGTSRHEPEKASTEQISRTGPVYLGSEKLLVRTEHGYPLICKSGDIQVTPALVYAGTWEPALTRFYQRNLKPGATYLEVGANIGYFTVLAANLVGHLGRVHAFEPEPEAFSLLALNCRLNHCSYICELVPRGVADSYGSRTLHRFEHNFGSSTLSELPEKLLREFNEVPSTIQVSCTTLDEYYKDRPITVDFIKLDAEGAEPLIFEGGQYFFEQCFSVAGVVAMEFNPQAILGLGRNPTVFIEKLRALGFQIWKLNTAGDIVPIHRPAELDLWCNSELVMSRGSGSFVTQT